MPGIMMIAVVTTAMFRFAGPVLAPRLTLAALILIPRPALVSAVSAAVSAMSIAASLVPTLSSLIPSTISSSASTLPTPASRMIFRSRSKILRQLRLIHGVSEQVFDSFKFILFLLADKGEGGSVRLGAGGPADPVHIILAVIRNIVIDDHFYVVDIDPPGKNIRRDQYWQPPTLKLQ